ncbi:hypothetical protein [Paraburkholderia bannensis]|uniref:hypothetical protein n=1 Tax=Paraburkholderia bannensis TaxID=765414 RepID=UPI002AB70BBA|nr:hypothetical protein [Paraburkholderia bannensis]
MKRLFYTATFAALGILSLWYWMVADALICRRFPQFCEVHGCRDIDKCPFGFWDGAAFLTVLAGPAIVFGLTAFLFAKRQRSWQRWSALSVGLVTLHWSIMLIDRLFG